MAKYPAVFGALIILVVGSACSDVDEAALTPADFAITDSFRPGTCESVPEWSDVRQGSIVDTYLSQSNGEFAQRKQTIEQSSQGTARERSYWERVEPGARDRRSSVTTEYWRGLLPLGQRSDNGEFSRNYTYDNREIAALQTAKTGDFLRLNVREELTLSGKNFVSNHQFEVKFEGCGSIRVLTEWEPVRVYQLVLYGTKFVGNAVENVRTDVRIYYSGKRGWYLRKDRPNGTFEVVRSIQ